MKEIIKNNIKYYKVKACKDSKWMPALGNGGKNMFKGYYAIKQLTKKEWEKLFR